MLEEEKRVFIQSGGLKIEGLLGGAQGQKAVVVTHPHPLYGGDMHNNVVEAIVKAYSEKGYTTLRINFRGVGQSDGSFDEGLGEQEDVEAALTYLQEMEKPSIDLAGYSFGAWVNARGLKGFVQVERMIMVSPPVNFIDFSFLDYNPKIRLVIAGSGDDIGPPEIIQKMLPNWNPDALFKIIQGADHFYWGKSGEIEKIVRNFLESEGEAH
jgi:alpha/beta superfamily hydrolase